MATFTVAPLLLFAITAVVIGGFAFLMVRLVQQQRRREQQRLVYLNWFATTRGWTLEPQEPGLVGMSQCEPFGVGHSRTATEVLRGAIDGYPFVSFTYTYLVTTSNGKSTTTTTYHFMVTSISTPPTDRYLQVTHEGLFNSHDLQLESEDFNRRFKIDTNDDRFAYDVLSPTTMQRMLADRRTILPLRFENSNLMTWRADPLNADWVEAHVRYLIDTLRAVPGYAWEDHNTSR